MSPRTRILAVLLLAAGAARALPPPWVPLGPFGGGVRTVTADPTRPGIVYATTYQEVFKTADSGASWTVSSLETPSSSVAVDPVHPSTLYVGVQDEHLLLKSDDGGAHWTPASAGLPGNTHSQFPLSVAIDPSDPRRLLLAYNQSVWRSADAGASWQPAASGPPSSFSAGTRTVAFAAHPAGTAFAATGAGLYRTTDAGLSWKRLDHGLPVAAVSLLALAPSDPRTVYVYLAGLGLYRTADGGASWRQASGPSDLFGTALAVSPQSPRTLYAGTSGGALFRSTNGGARWAPLSGVSGVTSLAFDAGSPRRIYAGVLSLPLGGVWQSDDGGSSWARRSQGITGLGTSLLAVDPQDPDRLWITVGASPAGAALFRSSNGGIRWSRAGLPSQFPPERLAVGASSDLFAAVLVQIPRGPAGAYSIFKKPDGGASWKQVLDVLSLDVRQIRPAPSDPSTIYAAGGSLVDGVSQVYRSVDNGEAWELRSKVDPPISCGIFDLAVAPSAAGVVYLSGGHSDFPAAPCQRVVLRSSDGGATWASADAGLPAAGIVTLAVDPRDPDRVYAGTSDGVWKSADGGRAWSRTGAGLADHTITFLLASMLPGRVYAVEDFNRVFRSDDGGATWQAWSRGLRDTILSSLAADSGDPRRIYAATFSGTWVLTETD
jgi:photosystem II stability/assembly factor-like uncharacterized protein